MREREEANRTREAGHLDEIQGVAANTLNSCRNEASLLAKAFGVGFSWIAWLVWNAFFIGLGVTLVFDVCVQISWFGISMRRAAGP